ncbi:uncharacterized protein [Ptychodera flava]|uniref:uncharacterized protein n=1 Tax=Ptychodera flava TaxID=63121 RepID=UPI00396A12B0
MQNTKEFGYYVISETDVDRLVSDFKKWRLISKDDERLLLYVKRVFEKEGTEDLKAACPDIKSNVHLTVRCSKFNVVLKAGKCYNICTVYMERSKPKYKCKRLSGWRRVVENISMYKFDKVLKDVRLGPFRLDLSDEITGGGADEAFVDEDDDGFNDDDHDDDFGDDGGDELS